MLLLLQVIEQATGLVPVVIDKNKPSHTIVRDSALFSLLGTDSSAISVNPSQSFPLQFSSHKVSEEYLPVYTQQDLYQRRCNLVEKIATTMKQSYNKEEKLWDDILTKRSSKNVSTNNEQYHHLIDKLLPLDSQDEIVTYLGRENFFEYKKIFFFSSLLCNCPCFSLIGTNYPMLL